MIVRALARRALRQQTLSRTCRLPSIKDTPLALAGPSGYISQARRAQTEAKPRQSAPSIPRSKQPKAPLKTPPPSPRSVPPTTAPSPAQYNASERPVPEKQEVRAARELLDGHDRLLLYHSPRHGSLLVTSILTGTAFISCCATAAEGVLYAAMPMWLAVPTGVFSTIGVAIGINAFITTLRCIDKVWLIRDDKGGYNLRIGSKWRMYFWQPRFVEAPLEEVFMDRTIEEHVLTVANVKLEDRFLWTQMTDDLNGRRTADLRPWSARLRTAWPQFKRDLARTYARNGMARVRVRKDVWKLDTYHSVLLDGGQPLAAVAQEDLEEKSSVYGIVRRHLVGF